MSPALALGASVVRDTRTVADLAREHAEASARINRPHSAWTGQVLPRDFAREAEERSAMQTRLDNYKSYAFQAAEAANVDHWSN